MYNLLERRGETECLADGELPGSLMTSPGHAGARESRHAAGASSLSFSLPPLALSLSLFLSTGTTTERASRDTATGWMILAAQIAATNARRDVERILSFSLFFYRALDESVCQRWIFHRRTRGARRRRSRSARSRPRRPANMAVSPPRVHREERVLIA